MRSTDPVRRKIQRLTEYGTGPCSGWIKRQAEDSAKSLTRHPRQENETFKTMRYQYLASLGLWTQGNSAQMGNNSLEIIVTSQLWIMVTS
jgi:hypothetical protein